MNNWFKLVFFVFMLSVPTDTLWGQCASIYRKAETLMSEGKYKDAIKNFKAAMQCDNNLTESCNAKIAECERKIRTRTSRVSQTVSYGLTVEKDSLIFNNETTSSVIVRVQSTPKEWTVVSDAEWCKAVSLGNRVSISCEINDDIHERTAKVTVSNGKKKTDIVVVQRGKKAEEYIRIGIDKLRFSNKNELKEIPIETNTKWEVSEIPSWCKIVVKEDNKLIIRNSDSNKTTEGVLVLKTSSGKTSSILIISKIPVLKKISNRFKRK